jgi:hypothetical protein
MRVAEGDPTRYRNGGASRLRSGRAVGEDGAVGLAGGLLAVLVSFADFHSWQTPTAAHSVCRRRDRRIVAKS